MQILGIFLILFGIAFDESSTLLAFIRGLGVLETNPVFVWLGPIWYLVIMISIYIYMIFVWLWIIKTYKRVYHNNLKVKKLFDVFVYLACLVIIFTAGMKIQTGYNNVVLLVESYEHPVEMKAQIDYATNLQKTDFAEYQKQATTNYFDDLTNITYWQFFFYSILAYLLMRVGNKVCPYEEA